MNVALRGYSSEYIWQPQTRTYNAVYHLIILMVQIGNSYANASHHASS